MRIANMVSLVLIAAAITITAGVVMTGIAQDSSMQLAYVHAHEAVGHFNLHVSGELALLRKAANEGAVREWFADEGDPEKKAAAFNVLMNFAASLQSAEFYIGIASSLNEYAMDLNTTLAGFAPYGRMTPGDSMDAWFFDLLAAENSFLFNIDVDKIEHRWRIWINYTVEHEGQAVGVLASSVRIYEVLESMFGRYDEEVITGFVIDNAGYIHMGSAYLEHYTEWVDELLHISSVDGVLGEFIRNYTQINPGFFTSESPTEIIRLTDSFFGYAAAQPIADSDWMVIILFSPDALFTTANLIPLAAVLSFATVLYVIISNFVSRRYVLAPLARLTESVAQVGGADADSVEVYGKDRSDEIGELSKTIQDMWHTLRDKTIAEERLAAENTALDSLSQMKSEYLANMSHETKTPLTLVSIHVQRASILFQELGIENEKIRSSLKRALDEVNRAANLTANALRLASMEENREQMKPVRLAALITDIAEAYRPLLEKRNNQLDTKIPEDIQNVIGNTGQLVQVVTNLLTNANNHTAGGTITVGAQQKANTIHVTVQDTGCGIEPELLPRIFERGVSGSNGTGFGLYICKNIIESHGGQIDMESEPGRGCTATFTLPALQRDEEDESGSEPTQHDMPNM